MPAARENRRARARGPARQGGFTLLEILVALVVLGLLLIGLTQGVRAGLAMWQAQTRRLGETSDLDASARTLRRLLSGIPQPPTGRFTRNRQGGGAFKGSAGRLSFIGALPTGLGATRRADITLELRGDRLVLLWSPYRHVVLLGPKPQPVETELLGGVARLDLAYWGAPDRNQAAAWHGQWTAPTPPELIRVRLAFVKGDRRHWPDLIAAPAP